MTLIVPLAELRGGRAPRVRVETAREGQAVAEFGERLAQLGEGLEADRLERELGRARVDVARELGRKRLEFEAVTDPDAIDSGWAAGAAELRERILGAADPRNADRLGLAFDEMADRHGLALGARAMDLRLGEYRINVENHARELMASSAGLDAGARGTAVDQLADTVAAAVAAGAMSPEDANALLNRQRDELTRTAAIRALSEDPAGLIAALDGGEFAGIDPIYAEGLRSQATGRLAAAAAEAARERERALDAELAEIGNIALTGRIPAQVGILSDPEAQARPGWAEAAAAVDLLNEEPLLGRLPPDAIAGLLARERETPIVRKWQDERRRLLERAHEEAVKGWGADPIGFAAARGMRVPELPEFDAAEPDAFVAALRARRTYGRALEAGGYGEVAIPLSLEEQAELREAAAVETDPEARAALAAAIGAGLGPQAARDLADDPVFGHMAGMLAAGGSPALAREAFRGQQAMAAENVALPPVADRRAPVFDQVETLLADLPGGEFLQAEIVAAADALYAARVRRIDPDADIDAAAYGQALHEALGGTGQAGRGGARGGVQEVNGALTILPPGIGAATVEAALERIATTREAGRGRIRVDADAEELAATLAGVSRSGRSPEIDGAPVTPRDLRNMTLRAKGDGVYVLVWNGQVLTDAAGDEYELALPELLRAGLR